MKNLSLFITFYISLLTFNCFSQDEIDIVDPYEMKVSRSKEADTFYFTQNAATTFSNNSKLDTLRSYDVFLEERPTPFGTAYMCNGKEVTKQKYYEYKKYWNSFTACTPCMLYTYDDKNQLKYNAFQYEECLCGTYTEYYHDKSKKVEGQFKENTTGNWQNMKGRNLCNVRDGVWTYFSPEGIVEKKETYVDGKLKETINPALNTSTAKKTTTGEEVDENTTKKGIFQRIKDKNKTEETQ